MSKKSRLNSAFVNQRSAILYASREFYRAQHEDRAADEQLAFGRTTSTITTRRNGVGRETTITDSEIRVGAKVVGRYAFLLDMEQQGGLTGAVHGFEARLSRLIDRSYLAPALVEGGIVDTLRGVTVAEHPAV